ncbi:MAG: excinuclease ABC subunit C [Clostridia bacterium]|nr:excinuclease ABC subunit C [Clostridia bacterium]
MASGGESAGEITGAFLQQFYAEDIEIPREIAVLDLPENHEALAAWLREKRGRAVSILRPQRGEKLQQVLMAERNGREEIEKQRLLKTREWERTGGAMARLSALIGLDEVPCRMECFDNSHIRGRDTVSSMVVFLDGKAAPKEYRRYRTKQDAGGDDLLAMREVLTRRYTRLKEETEAAAREGSPLPPAPDLIVIDGGRTQHDVAVDVLSSLGFSHIPVIGLAEREEHIILPDVQEPIVLARSDSALHVLQRIRDEAHRFAITYHRSLHVKTALLSTLDEIPGIGDKRKRALFDAFISRDAIAAAAVEELAAVKGMNRPAAEAVYAYFHNEEQQEKNHV